MEKNRLLYDKEFLLRCLDHDDFQAFSILEKKVWKSQNVVVISEKQFHEWVSTYQPGFLGAFRGTELLGYTYCVRTMFENGFLLSGSFEKALWLAFTQGYDFYLPFGNAWYGVSFAALPQSLGVGYRLVEELFRRAENEGIKYFFCTVRLPQMKNYFGGLGIHDPDLRLVSCYAYMCVREMKGKVHPSLERRCGGILLPRPRIREPVLSLMVRRFKCQLVNVLRVPYFEDKHSLNYEATLWRRI